LSDPSRNRIWPDTRLQTKGREIEHIQQEVWNFLHLLSGHASTIIYRCVCVCVRVRVRVRVIQHIHSAHSTNREHFMLAAYK
jgi:hypothetical protein